MSEQKSWTWKKACQRVQASKGRLTFFMSPDKKSLYVMRTSSRSRKKKYIPVTGAEMPQLLQQASERAAKICIEDTTSGAEETKAIETKEPEPKKEDKNECK